MTAETTVLPDSPVRRFFSGAGFPACILAGAIVYEAFLLAVVFAPPGWGPWSRFSQDFKMWCFSYDSRTGGMSWAAVWVMLVEPLFLASVAALIWHRNLRELFTLRGAAAHWRAITGGGMFALVAMTALFLYGGRDIADNEDLPFPGERIRTQIEPPAFQLTDQQGQPVSLEDFKGQVVLITGVYAMCSTACPEILREVKNLIESLPPEKHSRFSVVALSLNPEYDTSQVMNAVAGAYGFTWPQFRYANGDPQLMRDLLTRFQFSPVRNDSTGVIEHANLFLLLDARGVIAYRFNLNQRHLPWLRQAVLDLLNEASAPALADTRGP